MVTQIAGASAQQSSSTQSVDANLNRIAGSIERTTASSAQAVEACDRLSHLAADLNSLVNSFKVHDESLQFSTGRSSVGRKNSAPLTQPLTARA